MLTKLDKSSVNFHIQKLAHESTIALAGKIVGRVANLLIHIFIARQLGPNVFGIYILGFAMLRITSILTTIGLDKAVIRFSRSDGDGTSNIICSDTLWQALTFSGIFSCIVALLMTGFSSQIANMLFGESQLATTISAFALLIPVSSWLGIVLSAIQVSKQLKLIVYVEDLFQPFSHLFLAMLFVNLGGELRAIVLAFQISLVLTLLFALNLLWRTYPKLRFRAGIKLKFSKDLLYFSSAASISSIFIMMGTWIDKLFIGHFGTAKDVGIYQAATQPVSVFALVLTSISAIFLPMIVELYQSKNMTQLNEIFKVSTKWAVYTSIPIGSVIIISSDELLRMLFGENFIGGASSLVVLTLAYLINVGTGPVGLLLTMTGHQVRWFTLSTTILVINIVLNILLIPRMGIIGAAAGTALATSSLYLIALIEVRRRIDLWPYDKRYYKGLVATFINFILVFWLNCYIDTITILSTLMLVLLSYISFFFVLFVLRLENEDKELLQSFNLSRLFA